MLHEIPLTSITPISDFLIPGPSLDTPLSLIWSSLVYVVPMDAGSNSNYGNYSRSLSVIYSMTHSPGRNTVVIHSTTFIPSFYSIPTLLRHECSSNPDLE